MYPVGRSWSVALIVNTLWPCSLVTVGIGWDWQTRFRPIFASAVVSW
jgi:hypothetical protein